MTADRLVVTLDGALTRRGVGTEPGGVSSGATRDVADVRVGTGSIVLGADSGSVGL